MIDAFKKALAPYGEATITGSEHVSGAEVRHEARNRVRGQPAWQRQNEATSASLGHV